MNNKIFYSTIATLLIIAGFMGNRLIQNRSATDHFSEKTVEITMFRGEGCNCCLKWVDHLESHGFVVEDQVVNNLQAVKKENNIPTNLQSCHTAIVDGYIVEGHVPAAEIQRLISEKPEALGISVPGMPLGSPGMESSKVEPYNVLLFNEAGNQFIYAKY